MFAHSSSAARQGGAAAKCRVISSLEAGRRECHIPMHSLLGALPAGHLFIRSLMKLFHGGRVCYRPDPNRFMQAMFTTPGIMKATGRAERGYGGDGRRRGLDSVSLWIRWQATRVATGGKAENCRCKLRKVTHTGGIRGTRAKSRLLEAKEILNPT